MVECIDERPGKVEGHTNGSIPQVRQRIAWARVGNPELLLDGTGCDYKEADADSLVRNWYFSEYHVTEGWQVYILHSQLSTVEYHQSCSASLGNQHLKSTGMISSLNCFICVWWEGIKFHDNSSVFHFCLFSLIILLSLSPNAFLLLSMLIYYMSHAYSSWPSSFKISSFIYHQK